MTESRAAGVGGECFLSVLRSVRQGEGSASGLALWVTAPHPAPTAPWSQEMLQALHCGTSQSGGGAEARGSGGDSVGPAVHSLALNHTGRKLILSSLPVFPTGSRRASQLGATTPLTLNTFPEFSLRERLGLGKSNSIRPCSGPVLHHSTRRSSLSPLAARNAGFALGCHRFPSK